MSVTVIVDLALVSPLGAGKEKAGEGTELTLFLDISG